MKEESIYKFLFFISAFLVIGFCIRLGADYYQYSTALNSAPFSVTVIVRAVEFLLPSLIVFGAGIVTKKKYSK